MFTFRGALSWTNTPASGFAGLRVEAWDYDPGRDDYLGSAVTQHDGTFEIVFNENLFRELFTDFRPDLYFNVYSGAALPVSTQDSVIWNVKKTVTALTCGAPRFPP